MRSSAIWSSGHAPYVTQDGPRFEFKAGDAAYFPPRTQGTWTIPRHCATECERFVAESLGKCRPGAPGIVVNR
jgi:hypothetical protein